MSSIPTTMRAVEIPKFGGPDALVLGQRPVPAPGPDEVLVEVHATSINRLDVFQREGIYPIPPGASDIPGLDVAGVIAAVGAEVKGWKPGDKVCALLTGGGYADYCVTPAVTCLPVPAGMSFVQAAMLPETLFTVWSNIFDRAGLKSGESILVHGGAGGIGTFAIQLAKAMGATVFATAGSDEKCRRCQELGATRAINYKAEDFVTAVKAATEDKGVDVILDMVGGEYLDRNCQALALEGRLVQISLLAGDPATFALGSVLLKRLTLTGSTLRGRPPAFKQAIAEKLRDKVWPLVEAGKVRPIECRTFPLDEIVEAHRFFEGGDNFGKVGVRIR